MRLRLTALAARGYRNLGRPDLVFSAPWTGFVGPNGVGKTNTLEAIHTLCRLRGFRGEPPNLLRAWGDETLDLVGRFDNRGRVEDRRIEADDHGVRRTIDGDPGRGARDWATDVPLFGYRPDDDLFFHEEPAERRRRLDWFCAYLDPFYMTIAAAYKRTLRQRALALQRTIRGPELDAWEATLAEAGVALTRARSEAVKALSARFTELSEALPLAKLHLDYRIRGELEVEAAQTRLAADRGRDAELGRTACGPHRDDLIVSLAGRPIRESGSQGQRKLAIIALSLACALEAGRARKSDGGPTIFYLDDIEGELDATNESALFALLAGLPLQGFVTGVRRPAAILAGGFEATWIELG